MLSPLLCRAQESIIATVQSFRPSVVNVSAGGPAENRQGAGVIINQDGLVVCNLHTLTEAQWVTVSTASVSRMPARILRVHPQYDLALLKIPGSPELRPVRLADAPRLRLRQQVYHIGSSYWLDDTISSGHITGLGTSRSKKQSDDSDPDIIRVDIRLYRGDSGGPLFNRDGGLIGMIVAKDTRRDRVSFAVPVNKIKKILSEL